MAVVTVTVADDAPNPRYWAGPGQYSGNRSPIPRGLITYTGADAIALKGAGDETVYALTLTMPPNFAYLLRNLMVTMVSDDLTNNFNLIGKGSYAGDSFAFSLVNPPWNLISAGEFIEGAAVKASRIWVPGAGTPKLILQGGDRVAAELTDMDAGASTAGDMFYFYEFYVFDITQIDKWELNTPIPTISHTSF